MNSSESRVQEIRRHLDETLQNGLRPFLDSPAPLTSAQALQAYEARVCALLDELHSLIMALAVQAALVAEVMRAASTELVRCSPSRHKCDGERELKVVFQRGPAQTVVCVYYRRAAESAARKGKGLWPGLLLLGFFAHRSPAANAMVAIWVCALASLQEAHDVLARQGVQLDIKTLRAITRRFGQRARQGLASVPLSFPPSTTPGRRIVISTDGGRIRIRTNKRGKRTAKGRQRFHADWREPCLLHIGCYRADGTLDPDVSPIIDGTLDGPDAVFMLIHHYVRAIGLTPADKVLLIADAAPWIWLRFDLFVTSGLLNGAQLFQLIDFYHAVQHLRHFADACTHWPSRVRNRWFSQTKTILRQGKIQSVLERFDHVLRARTRRSKSLERHAHYFRKNRLRFSYTWIKRQRLPIGSGPMESAVRRVVNLRLKGPGIFWHEESANAILLLRSFYKANRWNQLQDVALSPTLDLLY